MKRIKTGRHCFCPGRQVAAGHRYAQLKQAKTRLGLRSIAGAWEFMLRLGLAVVNWGVAKTHGGPASHGEPA
jgi:hypothetical protein